METLLDTGADVVLIRNDLVAELGLRRRKLKSKFNGSLATGHHRFTCLEWVKLKLTSVDNTWTSRIVSAIIAPELAYPVILGGPFLAANDIRIDYNPICVTTRSSGYHLLPPPVTPTPTLVTPVALPNAHEVMKQVLEELVVRTARKRQLHVTGTRPDHFHETLNNRLAILAVWDDLSKHDAELRAEFSDCFPSDIPHTNRLPTDVHHRFRLKDPEKLVRCRSYSCPKKYKDAWRQLLDQHIQAGRIRESSSEYCSPAFLIPKADTTALPRWVNDYRQLNENTVPDHYPLPRVQDILGDCARGSIWAKIDMTNAFFQTRVHPDDIKYTAVMTPLGLYEWLVMPMGCRNAPATHQRRMNKALRRYIGKICHVYLDDIIIWSNSIEEHQRNVRTILQALRDAQLYCSVKKTQLFTTELDFLGHHISARGIEPDSKKVEQIRTWPVPKDAKQVRRFLGLVRYLALFLPRLAEYTSVLTPLTTKDAERAWPGWKGVHQRAFQNVKDLCVGAECLTTIDHDNMGENRIFVTCDASNRRTGACLSFGKDWQSARPVAWDSMQLSSAQQNYATHELELLAIVRALKKFRSELLGTHFTICTDHRTLESFLHQRELSRRQARWQEFLADYTFDIRYIRGTENTVADALSRRPDDHLVPVTTAVATVMSVSVDAALLESIKAGYGNDKFAQRLLRNQESLPSVSVKDGLIFLGNRLVIPRVGNVREELFRLAHDNLGHFGSEKSYATLYPDFYWPRMRTELEDAYLPGCDACQRNKGTTKRRPGPLHPLPVPDERGDSIAIDFIGPLPVDEGYNCIITITDRLGSDVRLIPTTTDISAEEFARLFFDHWYCENGLPLEIISDRDKLFVSRFWKALTSLSGVKLGMSTVFHPQTDGASERTNKTINQCLRYHVSRNQEGWVRALPRVRFAIMNTVNASTKVSPFQLRMGRSPRLVPPILPHPATAPMDNNVDSSRAQEMLDRVKLDVQEAKDNLMLAKIFQADQANRYRTKEDAYKIGDKVMLSTANRRKEYAPPGSGRVTKFFPRHDGPYEVTAAYPQTSTYKLGIPDAAPNMCLTFHASQLKRYVPNKVDLFPDRELERPGPVTTSSGEKEHVIDRIVDERKRGRGYQYLVRWKGYGEEDKEWLPRRDLEETIALGEWLDKQERRRRKGGRV